VSLHDYDIFMKGCVVLVMSNCHYITKTLTGYDVLVYYVKLS